METEIDEHQALKDLAIEFEIDSDPIVFVKILIKVDGLLKYQINRFIYTHPYLCSEEFCDLYQAAVIGLYAALAKVKQNESGGKIIYNIRRYVVNEILKEYKDRSGNGTEEFFEDIIQQELVDNSKVYVDLEREFIRDRFCKLVTTGVISQEEFDVIYQHFVYGVSYKVIARQNGCATGTISKKVRDSLNRLRFEFRRRHWEDG